MNSQKETKLNLKDTEIARLKKELSFIQTQLKFTKLDLDGSAKNVKQLHDLWTKIDTEKTELQLELLKIKNHWLYKLAKKFK